MSFIEHEYTDIGPVSLAELADVEVPNGHELVYVETAGHQPSIPYEHGVTHFPALDEWRPGINITTPKREVFLRHGDEAEAQTALKSLTLAIHSLTGGVVTVHPFYGAIYNDIIDPVSIDWKKKPGDIILDDDWLSTRISLVANGGVFSDTISEDAASIALNFSFPSSMADRYIANRIVANRVNPNQSAKDQAASNGLAERWMAEFERYNPSDILEQEPMSVNLGSIALLMNSLSDSGVFTTTTATVRVRQPV